MNSEHNTSANQGNCLQLFAVAVSIQMHSDIVQKNTHKIIAKSFSFFIQRQRRRRRRLQQQQQQ